jgi:hypothetical protein
MKWAVCNRGNAPMLGKDKQRPHLLANLPHQPSVVNVPLKFGCPSVVVKGPFWFCFPQLRFGKPNWQWVVFSALHTVSATEATLGPCRCFLGLIIGSGDGTQRKWARTEHLWDRLCTLPHENHPTHIALGRMQGS